MLVTRSFALEPGLGFSFGKFTPRAFRFVDSIPRPYRYPALSHAAEIPLLLTTYVGDHHEFSISGGVVAQMAPDFRDYRGVDLLAKGLWAFQPKRNARKPR